jgi:hypothetical protein
MTGGRHCARSTDRGSIKARGELPPTQPLYSTRLGSPASRCSLGGRPARLPRLRSARRRAVGFDHADVAILGQDCCMPAFLRHGSQRGNVLRHGIKKGATFWTGCKTQGVIDDRRSRAYVRGAAAAPSLAIPRAAMLSFSAPRLPVTERRGYSVFRGGPGSAAGEHGGRRCGQAHPVAPREARARGRGRLGEARVPGRVVRSYSAMAARAHSRESASEEESQRPSAWGYSESWLREVAGIDDADAVDELHAWHRPRAAVAARSPSGRPPAPGTACSTSAAAAVTTSPSHPSWLGRAGPSSVSI